MKKGRFEKFGLTKGAESHKLSEIVLKNNHYFVCLHPDGQLLE